MPRFHFQDGTSRNVSQAEYERLEELAEEAFYECFALAKWLAWCCWTEEFGENNPNFPFNPNGREIFSEAERLMQ